MSGSDLKFPIFIDECLKDTVRRDKIFSLNTNLSDLGGPGVNYLCNSLMLYSMKMPNKRIIEIIMYENQYAFRTMDDMQRVMNNNCQVIEVFTKLGNYNIDCNLLWLIHGLYRLGELTPLKDILYGAPPLITKLAPKRPIAEVGDSIVYEIRTVSISEVNWWKSDSNGTTSFGDTIQVNECSIVRHTYRIKSGDEGSYFIVADSLGKYHETSEKVFVGKEDTIPYVKAYEEIQDKVTRVALLIGIMDYSAGHELIAPKYDIALLDPILRNIGFKVHNFCDLNLNQLNKVLEKFSEKYVNKDTYIFFYFAGHGMSENTKDYVQLSGFTKVGTIEILKILSKNEPKVLLAIFDMCRNDTNNKESSDINMAVSSLPINESLMLVMSTFPQEKAFEMKKKYESHSQIIKPLCNCLQTYACTEPINIAISRFVSDPSITGQKPVFYSGPKAEIIGKMDFPVPKFRPTIKWEKETLDLHFNFDVCHNILSITLDDRSNDLLRPRDFSSKGQPGFAKTVTFNLFNIQQVFDDEKSLRLKVYRCVQQNGNKIQSEIPFKISLPLDILDFIL